MMKKTVKRLGAAALALCMMLSMMISASAVLKYYVKVEIYDTKYDVTVSKTGNSVSPNNASLAAEINTLLGAMYEDMDAKFDTTWMGTTLKYGTDAYLAAIGEGGDASVWTAWVDKTYTDEVDDTESGKLKELIRDLDTKVSALFDDGNAGKVYKMSYTPEIRENYSSDKAYGNTYVFSVTLTSKNVVSGGGGMDSLEQAASAGADLLITGDFCHEMYHLQQELNIPVLSLGHYASETVGVKAVMNNLNEKFGISVEFADIPTGL